MKTLAAAMTLSFLLGACASDESSSPTVGASNSAQSTQPESASRAEVPDSEASEASDGSESGGAVEVDKGLLNVEILLPADFIEFFSGGGSPEAALAEISEEGFEDAAVNADGSVLLTMSRLRYERLMNEQRAELERFIDGLPGPDSGITRAEANRDFTEFIVTVDRAAAPQEALEMLGFLNFALLINVGVYQLFDGADPEDTSLRVEYVDAATGEVFDVFDSEDQ